MYTQPPTHAEGGGERERDAHILLLQKAPQAPWSILRGSSTKQVQNEKSTTFVNTCPPPLLCLPQPPPSPALPQRPGPMPIIAQQQGPIMNLVPPSSYGMETNGLPPVGSGQDIQGDASTNVRLPGHGGEREWKREMSCMFYLRARLSFVCSPCVSTQSEGICFSFYHYSFSLAVEASIYIVTSLLHISGPTLTLVTTHVHYIFCSSFCCSSFSLAVET